MALESGTAGVWALDVTNPPGSDDVSQADDHLRMIKGSLKRTFSGLSATVSSSAIHLNAQAFYGSMYFANSSSEFSASTSLDLFTGFITPGDVGFGTTTRTASGAIIVSRPGHYRVDAQMSISASTAAIITVGLFVDNTDTGLRGSVLVPAQGRGSVAVGGDVSMGASQEIRMRIMATVAKLITPKDGSLRIRRLN